MQETKFLGALIAAAICAGCTADAVVPPAQSAGTPNTVMETRAFAGACLQDTPGQRSGFLVALGSAVLPSLIDVSLSTIGSALREAAKEKTISEQATLNVNIDGKLPSCIYLVRGNFVTNRNDPSKKSLRDLLGLPAASPYQNVDTNADDIGLYLSKPPEFFLEGRLITSSDAKAFTVRASTLQYNAMLDRSALSWSSSSRDLVISVALLAPESQEGKLQQMAFRDVTPQLHLMFDQDRVPEKAAWETPWTKMPSAAGPHTFHMSFSETRDANAFLQFLSEVFDGSREGIETAIKQATLQSEREKLRQQRRESEIKEREDNDKVVAAAIDAFSAARLASLLCDQGGGSTAANINLLADYQKKRLSAVTAVAKAGNPSELDLSLIPERATCP